MNHKDSHRVKIESDNVHLQTSHRKHLMASLRRAIAIGSKLGQFVLNINIRRVGRFYELRADVHDARGEFGCKARASALKSAWRELVRDIHARVHAQRLQRV